MSVAQSRLLDTEFSTSPAAPLAGDESARDDGKAAAARLADALASPTASPVHRLQAELARLTTPEVAPVEQLYPGWFRLGFPIAASGALWTAILWGVGIFG